MNAAAQSRFASIEPRAIVSSIDGALFTPYEPPTLPGSTDDGYGDFGEAELATNGVGTKDCAQFRHSIFRKHRSIEKLLSSGYLRIVEKENHRQANLALLRMDARLTIKDFRVSFSPEQLEEFALNTAKRLEKVVAKDGPTIKVYNFLYGFVEQYGIEPPPFEQDICPAINRMINEYWWRQQLRRIQSKAIDEVARDLRLVNKTGQPYCSNEVVRLKGLQDHRNRVLLQNHIAYKDDDPDTYAVLADLVDASVSNPSNRHAELMVRMRGFEECAKELGHTGLFLTLTCPSRFHPTKLVGKFPKQIAKDNPKYDGSSARESHGYLVDLFKLIRAQLAKHCIKPYGFRVVEPHHDGCAHWHLLLFVEPEQSQKVIDIFEEYALKDSPEEPGAKQHRFKAKIIDPAKGSAAGYMSKYIAKGTTGAAIDNTTSAQREKHYNHSESVGLDPVESANRISIWARTHAIRQFQPIGGPSVSVWREMRRFRDEFKEENPVFENNSVAHFALENVRRAADSSDWAAFCIAMGGVQVKRKDQRVRLVYDVPALVDELTGEIIDATTRFGDKAKARIFGVAWEQLFLLTRNANWKVENKEKFLAAQKRIMGGVSDFFEAAIEAEIYQEMQQEKYEAFLEKAEELEDRCLWSMSSGDLSPGVIDPLDLCQ